MSTPLIIAICILLALAVLGAVLKSKLRESADTGEPGAGDNYTLRPSLLSPAERSFLGVLEPLLPDGVGFVAKIRLGDVFVTRKGLDASRRSRAWNKINQKHVDFLLVRTTDFKPLAGVELDDRSHEAADRKARDTFVDDVFKSCQLPLLHVTASATYNPSELRAAIARLVAQAS